MHASEFYLQATICGVLKLRPAATFAASHKDSARVHASGVADKVGSPDANPGCPPGGSRSRTCSAIRWVSSATARPIVSSSAWTAGPFLP
ncbi:MAG TPA: hypothetical protein VFI99_07635 [Nocardioides sp.]|nr:hypothetical protein [Nocardioides sp.]